MFSCSDYSEDEYYCEELDAVLKEFCANITPTVEIPTINCPPITPSQCSMATSTTTIRSACSQSITATTTIKVSPSCSQPHPASSHQKTTNQSLFKSEVNSTSTAILGALLGLSVVLLAVVTTGWVWTCWTMKKRENSMAQNRLGTISAITLSDETSSILG